MPERKPWHYEHRLVLQQDNRRRLNTLAQQITPLVASGDKQGIVRARQITEQAARANHPRQPEVVNRISQGMAQRLGGPAAGGAAVPQAQPPEKEDGGLFGGLRDLAGDVFSAVDTPLSERIGVRIPDLPGPIDEAGNFIIEEASRPTTWGIAAGGAGLAGRLGATAARGGARGAAARGAQMIAEPALRGGFGRRLAGETALGVGARVGGEQAMNLVGDDAPLPLRIGAALAGGLAGGAAGARAAGGLMKPTGVANGLRGAESPEPLRPVLQNKLGEVYGMREPDPIDPNDEWVSTLRETVSGKPVIEEKVTPLFRERARLLDMGGPVDNYATQSGMVADVMVKYAFEFDESGMRIPSLAGVIPEVGAPTVADVAARLPTYAPHLTPEQVEALGRVRSIMEPFYQMVREQGIDLNIRGDIEGGGQNALTSLPAEARGFYIPRRRDKSGQFFGGGGGRAGSKKGSERRATLESQAAGIEQDIEYRSVGEAISAYAREMGARSVDEQIKNQLKALEDVYSPATNEQLKQIRAEVNAVRAKLATKRHTLERQLGRVAQQKGETRRTARTADDVARRTGRAGERFERGSTAAQRMADQGRAAASDEVSRLDRSARRLEGDADRAGSRADRARERATRTELEDAPRSNDPFSTEVDDFLSDDWLVGREVLDVDDANFRAAERELRVLERLVKRADRETSAADRRAGRTGARLQRGADEVARQGEIAGRDLERGVKRADTATMQSLGRFAETTSRIGQSKQEIKALRDELDRLKPVYEKSKEIANQVPEGMGRIQMAGLENYSFPERIAVVANNELAKTLPLTGRGAGPMKSVNALNRLLRMMGATLDVSFMGIQGLLGATSDPKAYRRAMKVAYSSMLKDPQALGAYLRTKEPEFLTAAVRDGLRISGAKTEFTSTGGGLGRFSELLEDSDWFRGKNPIRGSNRGFGTFGDVMRLELYEGLMETAAHSGLDVADPAVRAAVASGANLMTGTGNRAFLGDEVGGLVVFAPRYFQSQLDLIGKAWSDGSIEGAIARRAFTRLAGAAIGLTWAANHALGQETDWEVDSPNFMRIRAGGQDISVLGPWNSVIGQVVRLSSGRGVDRPSDLFRSESPILGAVVDLWSGENFRGEPTRTPEYLATRFLPFSVQNAIEEGPSAGSLLNPVGVNATPMSPYDRLDAYARFAFGAPWHELEPAQQEEVRLQEPELWQEYAEGNDTRGRAEAVRLELRGQQEAADEDLLAGVLTREEWRNQRSDRLDEQSARLMEIYGDDPITDEETEGNPMLRYVQQIQLNTDPRTGAKDWDAIEAAVSSFTSEERAYLDRNLGVRQTPLSRLYRDVAQEYYELPRYKGYTADEAREIDAVWQEVRNRARSSDDADMLRALRRLMPDLDPKTAKGVRHRIVGLLKVSPERAQYLEQNPEAEIVTGSGTLGDRERSALTAVIR